MTKEQSKANLADKHLPASDALTAAATPRKTEEANEAQDKPPKKLKPEDDPAYTVTYEQGRAARRASIAKADCPHGDGAHKDAWVAGYEAEDKGARG